MEKIILISLPEKDLQTMIIDCVNTCLHVHSKINNKALASDLSIEDANLYVKEKISKEEKEGLLNGK